MAPTRARTTADDTKAETSQARERAVKNQINASRSWKHSAFSNVQTLKDSASVTSGAVNTQAINSHRVPGNGIPWILEDLSFLESYRIAYHLDAQSAFRSALTTAVLTSPGIGRHSPTMTRKKEKRKITRDSLCLAVRKHFNSLAVNEADVVVNFLYKVKSQDVNFRMRFAQPKHR